MLHRPPPCLTSKHIVVKRRSEALHAKQERHGSCGLLPCRAAPQNRGGGGASNNNDSSSNSSPDLIERAVAFLFGEKALADPAPMGMKRIDFDKLPDQRVVTDRAAALLPGDEGDAALVRPLLAGTQLEEEPLAVVYDADAHGWAYRDFHARADGAGAALVLARSTGGAVFGGYNPEGWIGLGEDRASNGAFLFAWPDGDTSKPPLKLPKIGGPNLAVIDRPDTGPRFGADGLFIALKPVPPADARRAATKLGTYYARAPQGNGKSLWGGGGLESDPKRCELASLRVLAAASGGAKWQLDPGSITWRSTK